MHVPIKVKYLNNISERQMEFNLAFNGLNQGVEKFALRYINLSILFGVRRSSSKVNKIKVVKCTLVEALRFCTGRTAHGEGG
jgi:hypothetical protein